MPVEGEVKKKKIEPISLTAEQARKLSDAEIAWHLSEMKNNFPKVNPDKLTILKEAVRRVEELHAKH